MAMKATTTARRWIMARDYSHSRATNRLHVFVNFVASESRVADRNQRTRALFVERGVCQQVNGRHHFVARHEALAEITKKVVVSRLRSLRDDTTARLAELVLHLQAGK